MKIKYLGTGASEGVPAIFCVCKHCQYARKQGGKEIRSRCAALIDDTLMIDFGPDTFRQMVQYDLDLSAVRALLITHTHGDHLSVLDVSCRQDGFSLLPENDVPLTVYGNAKVGEKLSACLNPRLHFCEIKPFKPMKLGEYCITALEAVHCIRRDSLEFPVETRGGVMGRWEEAIFYLIERENQSILYAHDTDEFTSRTLEYLAGRKIDLISLDCNNGKDEFEYFSHMGAQGCLRMKEKLLANGAADEHTVFVANHFSHNGLLPFAEMEKLLPGFVVSYDGMTCVTEQQEENHGAFQS